MEKNKLRGRQLKHKILEYLRQEDFASALAEICALPGRRVANPLFSFLCSLDEAVKWRAVTALGMVVADLADREPESARVIMRRFMWSLNDESGGIGWGSPEAMGEAMARSDRLAGEYGCILASYIRPGGNFLEHARLQRGVLWAVARLAHARPRILKSAAADLLPYLQSEDANLRGLAAWAAGALANRKLIPELEKLSRDAARLKLYRSGRLAPYTVAQLAREALSALK